MSVSNRHRASVVPMVASPVGSILAAVLAYRLWDARLGVPFSYSGDALPHAMNVKQVVETGWFWSEPRLGAPFGQNFRDWPLPEVLQLLVGKLLTPFSSNWAAVVNGMFLLSFPLAALSACWFLLRLGMSRWNAAVLGILFSVLPYHMVRGVDHLFLAGYYAVPLGALLAVDVLRGMPLFPRDSRLRMVRTIIFCVLVGMSGAYYSAFTVLFVSVALIVRLVTDRAPRPALSGALACALILGIVVVDTLPTLLYRQEHGANLVAARREPQESDLYGLKLAQMLMPAPGHRIAAFDDFQNRYYERFPIPGERGSAALGAVASAGLLSLLALVLLTLARRGPAEDDGRRGLALLTLVGIVVTTVGGLTTFVALLVSSQIRSWNRISIFIGLFGLAAAGMLVDAGVRKFAGDRRRWAAPAAATTLLLVGVADQTTPLWTPPYEVIRTEFLTDQVYFRSIEARMPTGAEVFQLPRMQFPEGAPVGTLGSYGLLKPYMHTRDLRWSFGGIKGRLESAWQDRLAPSDSDAFTFDLVAAGFDGLYLDRDGYEDSGAAVESAVARVVGSITPTASADGRKVFYDLRSYAERLRLADASRLARRRTELLFPVYMEPNDEFYPPELDKGHSRWWADGHDAAISIYDGTPQDERARVTFAVRTARSEDATFTISWPDGFRETRRGGGAAPLLVSRELVTPKGRSAVEIVSDAARLPVDIDPRDLRFHLLDPLVLPS